MRAPSHDLSLELVRSGYPARYRTWVLSGVCAVIGGYGASASVLLAAGGLSRLWRAPDVYAFTVGCLAYALLRRGRARVAAALILAAIWIDIHVSIALKGPLGTASGMVVPALVVATALLLGGRAAMALAGSLLISVAIAVALATQLGPVAGFESPLTQLFLVAVGASSLGTAALLVAFLRTFAEVLLESRANERRAHQLVEEAPDAVIVLGRDGRVEALNRAAESVLGVSRDAVVGAAHASLPLRDEAGLWSAGAQALAQADGPIVLRVGDGPTQLDARVRPTTRADGSEALLVVLRDVTERRVAEDRAAELQDQLQHAQKLEAVGRLAGGIAHDFNNLLTAIGGFGSLVALSNDPKARSYGQEIVSAQKRGAALVRQLLAFARKDVSQPKPIDVAVMLGEMSVLLQRLVGERVTVALEPHGPCPILCDPGRFEQVLLNLAANARDAMPSGGTLRLVCEADEARVTFRVSDTGQGMPPEVRARIFEPFFTTKARSKGTGLGLSTVHGIVTDSGGSIEVDSEEGKGTCFVLRWPRSFLLADRHASSQSLRAVSGRGLSILLVEDDDQARTYVAQLLQGHGYAVDVAVDAEQALQLTKERERAPDLLLSDVVMPGMSGPELARRLSERWPLLRVLFMSGYLGDVGDHPGIDPVRDLIGKPFSGRDLLEHIDRKLG